MFRFCAVECRIHARRERRDSLLDSGSYKTIGRCECGHCQADEYIGSKQLGEHLANKLSKADPEDLGLSPDGERA